MGTKASPTDLPTTALFSPMSCRSSSNSHMEGYATLTSSTSTVNKVNPARPRRLDMSLESARDIHSRSQVNKHSASNIPVIGET